MKQWILSILVLAGLVITTNSSNAQHVEADLGVGYTFVNLNEWAGSGIGDYNQLLYNVHVQAFFKEPDNWQLGADISYTYFFWYTVPQLREVDATSISIVARKYRKERSFIEFAAGAYFFGEFVDFGVKSSAGRIIQLNDQLSIPLKFTTGIILDADAILWPLSLTAGLAYNF